MTSGADEFPITLIAAVARNGVIGSENGLPWRIKADMRHFVASTLGKPLVMGRKTFQSTGALPKRLNIVITSDPTFSDEGIVTAGSLNEALKIAVSHCRETGADEIMIGGGGEIYRQALPEADRLLITHIDADIAGDTTFPSIDTSVWVKHSETALEPSDGDTVRGMAVDYRRKR